MKSNRAKLIQKIDKIISLKVKERDKWTCQHCGKKVNGRNAHASHVLPKGKYPSLRFDMNNIKTLCSYCHNYWWHRNPIEATEWFIAKFPKRYYYLQKKKNEIKKFTVKDLEILLKELQNE